TALAPSGQSVWADMAVQSARALVQLESRGLKSKDIVTDASVRNAMTVHAAGLKRPTVDDWIAINRKVPRLVSVLPNGPVHHPTVRVFLAGGVPEVMLHLRRLDLLDSKVLTVAGITLGEVLDWWETSERRARFREILKEQDGVDADEVILSPDA